MDMSTSAQRKYGDARQRDRVEDLLERYPDVSAGEAAEILHFLKKGPTLEVGLMTGDDRLRPQLDRFRNDHRSEFTLDVREYLILAVILVAVVALALFLWDAGAP